MHTRRIYRLALPGGRELHLGPRTLIMGVLNVTPDSFSDGGRFASTEAAVEAALAMVDEGADLIDIGGESTRPGAAPVSAGEESARVLPVVAALARQSPVIVSVDTYKAAVARAAIDAGASIVNDVSGLTYDPAMAAVAAATGAGLVLMHTRGRSADMYRLASYENVEREVAAELQMSVSAALAAGVERGRLVVDPGLGFAKRAPDSLRLLAQLDADAIQALDLPILVGPSRKSFLVGDASRQAPPDRDWATAGAVAASVLLGAHIVRVHHVAAMAQVVRVVDALVKARAGTSE